MIAENNDEQFKKNSDFWISEIRGNVACLNDAAAIVETDIVLPTRVSDDITVENKINKIRSFQFEMRRLYKNSSQVLPSEIKKKMNIWFSITSKTENIKNVDLLKEGLILSDNLQDVLFKLGIKDIDIAEPVIFPYSYYLKKAN